MIEAAERWHDSGGHFCGTAIELLLHESVTALRESRKPKPRWTVESNPGVYSMAAWGNLTYKGERTAVDGPREAIEAIAAALNRAADGERGEP